MGEQMLLDVTHCKEMHPFIENMPASSLEAHSLCHPQQHQNHYYNLNSWSASVHTAAIQSIQILG